MVLGRDPRKSESHLYWLKGWGNRLQKHLETGMPSAASSYSYQPDPEAFKALAVYSTNFLLSTKHITYDLLAEQTSKKL